MASFNLECLTGVWNCIYDTIASPWVALFLSLLIYFSVVWTGTLNVGIPCVVRSVTKAVKPLVCRNILNASLCSISGGYLLFGLYLTLNNQKMGHLVSFVVIVLTCIMGMNVLSDIQKVSRIAQIGFKCAIFTRYFAFYLMLNPELRMTGLDLFFTGFFAQSLLFFLTQVAKKNSRKEDEGEEESEEVH